MGELGPILKGVGAAATNPLAFVAYIVAIAAWVFLRQRVDRNNNLLKRLTVLPKEDRLPALKAEMGTVPLNEGLSPEQWIRSRTHLYYFLGFVVLCAVLVILFAISAYTHTANAGYTHNPPDDLPEQNLTKAVDEIDLGVDRNFVMSKLGQPRHTKKVEGGSCTDYEFPFANVQLMFDRDDKVFFRYVAAKQDSYRPDILGDFLLDKKGCLGCFSFRDASRKPPPAPTPENPHPLPSNRPEDDGEPPVVSYSSGGQGSGFPSFYVENFPTVSNFNGQLFLVNTSDGFSSGDDGAYGGISQVMTQWDSEGDFGSFFEKLSPDQQKNFNNYRGNFKPNAWALLAADDSGQTLARTIPLYRSLAKGEVGSVLCQ